MIARYLILFTLLICFNKSKAQNPVINIYTTGKNAFVYSIYLPENNLTVCLTKRGNISNVYGGSRNDSDNLLYDEADYVDTPDRIKDKAGNLNVTYYDNFDWEELRGKIKSIGNLTFTYYDRFGWDETKGKLKSIGDVNFTYYDRFGWDETKGKLKSIGKIDITYYDRFDWDELKGKLKMIGNTSFTYYDRFDVSYKRGRLKAITGTTSNINILRPELQQSNF
jgi:hypothetical protein